MKSKTANIEIREIAKILDDAIENKDTASVLPMFTDDCVVELLGVKLQGRAGLSQWLAWLYRRLSNIRITPITIMVEGNTFFEEFVISARVTGGAEISSKQSEVLVFEGRKIKSLRLYFDRLDFADAVANDFLSRAIVKRIIDLSLTGLV